MDICSRVSEERGGDEGDVIDGEVVVDTSTSHDLIDSPRPRHDPLKITGHERDLLRRYDNAKGYDEKEMLVDGLYSEDPNTLHRLVRLALIGLVAFDAGSGR